jgi:integrase
VGSIYLRGSVYYVRYRDGLNRKIRERTDAKGLRAAQELLKELEGRAARQRKGLEPLPVDAARITMAELFQWWLDNKCPKASLPVERSRLRVHIKATPLGALRLEDVTPEAIEAQFKRMERAGAAPASINKMRGILHAVFVAASRPAVKKWSGRNPVDDTDTRTVTKKMRATLRVEELPGLLRAVPPNWRGFFAVAAYLGLRKGEAAGLLKVNVDLPGRTLFVTHSYDVDTTKGKRVDGLPIPGPLTQYLADALESSPSAWLFPGPNGAMRKPSCDPEKVLRTSLKRAGFIEGWSHTCRRCKAKGRKDCVELHTDSELRRCKRCNAKLWPKAIPRPMRFHDVRHSFATILLRAGTDLHRVQKLVRHASIQTTVEIYGHLVVEDLRPALEVFGPGAPRLVEVAPKWAQAGSKEPGGDS